MSDAPTTPVDSGSETAVLTLPVVPLSSTVVLPGAVVTLALDSDDGRRAAIQARQGDGRVLLVPQLENRYAKVGTIAHVENMGELPDGTVAAILRTVQRARIGAGVAGDGLWVRADAIDDPAPTSAQREVCVSCGPSLSRSRSNGARVACPRSCAPSTSPARSPTP